MAYTGLLAVGLSASTSSATAVLRAMLSLALQQAPPFSQINGIPVLTDVWGIALFVHIGLGGAAGVAGAGHGTVGFSIPGDPGLAGLTVFGEWFVWDPAGGGGAAKTRGVVLPLF